MDKKFKKLELKAIVNKKNGQINFSLPKRKLNKKVLDKINNHKSIKFLFEDE